MIEKNKILTNEERRVLKRTERFAFYWGLNPDEMEWGIGEVGIPLEGHVGIIAKKYFFTSIDTHLIVVRKHSEYSYRVDQYQIPKHLQGISL